MTLPTSCPKPEKAPKAKRKPLPPSSHPIPRGGIPRPRNAKRHAKNLIRAHGEQTFRQWIREQGCLICGRTPSDPAHMRSGGTSRKADVSTIAPLCANDVRSGYRGHHAEFDAGKNSFARKYDFDRDAAANATALAWWAHTQIGWRASGRDGE